jgi:uncharacterized damage-inducible protein DinB
MPSTSLLQAAFAHHVWATIWLIDACEELSDEQLQHTVPGTRGPIIQTLAHVVDSDLFDLAILEGLDLGSVDDTPVDLEEFRRVMRANGERWSALLSASPDPDADVEEVDPTDGFRRVAPVGVRLASTLDHGSDHRSQICTALTSLGVTPPKIDAMTFGIERGLVQETLGTG